MLAEMIAQAEQQQALGHRPSRQLLRSMAQNHGTEQLN